VLGMSDVLLDTDLSDEQREYAETIRASADVLITVVNDILDFSKIEAGALVFEKLDFTLRSLVETTVNCSPKRPSANASNSRRWSSATCRIICAAIRAGCARYSPIWWATR
jgi:K+-sensing histidine kinase KdpD